MPHVELSQVAAGGLESVGECPNLNHAPKPEKNHSNFDKQN